MIFLFNSISFTLAAPSGVAFYKPIKQKKMSKNLLYDLITATMMVISENTQESKESMNNLKANLAHERNNNESMEAIFIQLLNGEVDISNLPFLLKHIIPLKEDKNGKWYDSTGEEDLPF